ASAMGGDMGLDQLAEVALQPLQRAFLVAAHQPAVAGDIGRQDGREPSFGALIVFHGWVEFRGRQHNVVPGFARDGCGWSGLRRVMTSMILRIWIPLPILHVLISNISMC